MKFVMILLVSALAVLAVNGQIDIENIQTLDVYPPSIPALQHQIQGRIVGGTEVKPHDLPYQAGLAIKIGSKQAWCGGSLIADNWVMTAAHCTENADSVIVYLGAHNIKENEPETLKIEVPKENIIVHENWSMSTLRNDISLIRLPEAVTLSENIQTVNLPRRSQQSEKFDGQMTIASGWGKDTDKSETVSPVLRYVEVPVLPKWRCNIRYFGVIQDTHICAAGTGGKSTCSGDSGGPLVMTEADGNKVQLGLTSFGLALGCEWGWPGVFTRTSSYLDWISKHTDIEIRE